MFDFNTHKTEETDANLSNNNDKGGRRVEKNQPLNDSITDNLSLIFALRYGL